MLTKPTEPAHLNRYRLRLRADVARALRIAAADRNTHPARMVEAIIEFALSTGHLPPAPPAG